MPDAEPPDEFDYDWLFGQRSAGPAETPAPGFTAPDATRPLHVPQPPSSVSQPASPPPQQPRSASSFGGTYSQTGGGTGGAETRFAAPVRTARGGGPSKRPPAPPGRRTRPTGAGSSGASGPRRNWWVRGLILVVAAWLVFLVAVPIWAWSKVSRVDAEPSGHRPPDSAGTTYLLVGSDSRAGLTKHQEARLGTGNAAGQRTDTILLLDIPDSGPTLLLSIPRDSFVDIPGHGQNKINAAYSIGGPDLLVHTVEKATRIHIDNYVEIGFTGFVDIVNALGGIQVCPKMSIHDPKAGHLSMHKGCQHINGRTALNYSRSRAFPNGDITRELHQREVISSIGHQATSWQTFLLPWRYYGLNMAAAKAVRVGRNVSPYAVARFAWAMAHAGGKDTKKCVVPYSNLAAWTAAGSSVIWDQQRANAVFAAIRSGDTTKAHCSPQ